MIGLAFDKKNITVIKLKETATGFVLTKFARAEFRENPSQVIARLFAEQHIDEKEVYSAIGGPNKVQSRRLSLPPMPENELKEAIRWEAKNFVSFPVETAVVDYYLLEKGKRKSSKQDALVIAVDGLALEKQRSIIEQAGLKCAGITTFSFALWELTKLYPELAGPELTALVEVGNECLTINLFKNGFLQFTREIDIAAGKLEEEILSSFDYYREHFFEEKITRLFMVDNIRSLKPLKNFLNSSLSIPVEDLDPLKGIQVDPSLDPADLKEFSPCLAVALGLALGKGKEFNLLFIKNKKESSSAAIGNPDWEKWLDYVQIPNAVIFGTLGVFIVFLLALNFYLGRSIESTKKELDVGTLRLNQLVRFRDRKQAFEDISKKEVKVKAVLIRLNLLLPGGVSLSSLQLDSEKRSVELEGESKNPELASRFLRKLEESPYFEQARLIGIKKIGDSTTFKFAFKIT